MARRPGRLRKMRIVAQDPSVRVGGRILTASVEVPAEALAPGPRGYRVHVVDYDASSGRLYRPFELEARTGDWRDHPEAPLPDSVILGDPGFHAQNVYALVMRTLARFEFAFGRRVPWGFYNAGHQLKVVPHAFADANAFYSRRDEALLFGYFPSRDRKRVVFTCLSHDVVVHETTHAILDGLRMHFMEPSSPDQAAFHEAFADAVALLSVFSLPEIVRAVMDLHLGGDSWERNAVSPLLASDITSERLAQSVLLGFGLEFGTEMSPIGRSALRQSALLAPSPEYLRQTEFQEPHRRGEILVSALMNGFISAWAERLKALRPYPTVQFVDRGRAAEEGADAADHLLTMLIRALDYCPPVHIDFPTFLTAMLTADREINHSDERFGFRRHLLHAFRSFGIDHAGGGLATSDPGWEPPRPPTQFRYDQTHFESMQRNPDEVSRFVWENRKMLGITEHAHVQVTSVRPCVRADPEDGFMLRETVAEVLSTISLRACELARCGIAKPPEMPDDAAVTLAGGLTLVFDEYGRVKYVIRADVFDPTRPWIQQRQSERIAYEWEAGRDGRTGARRFSALHRRRAWTP